MHNFLEIYINLIWDFHSLQMWIKVVGAKDRLEVFKVKLYNFIKFNIIEVIPHKNVN